MPGTAFDEIFELIESTNQLEALLQTKGIRKSQLKKAVTNRDAKVGHLVRQAINKRQVDWLKQFATAVRTLKNHRPKPNHVLQAVTILGGISVREIALYHGKGLGPGLVSVPVRNGEILWTPIPASRKPCMNDVKKFIERQIGRELTPEEWARDSKKAERYIKDCNYDEEFDHRPGRKKP